MQSQAYLYANTATDYDPAGNVMRQRHVTSRDSLKTHDLPVSFNAVSSCSRSLSQHCSYSLQIIYGRLVAEEHLPQQQRDIINQARCSYNFLVALL